MVMSLGFLPDCQKKCGKHSKILIIKKFSLKWFYTWVQGQFFANISHLDFYIPGNINFGKVLGEIIDNVFESVMEASWI